MTRAATVLFSLGALLLVSCGDATGLLIEVTSPDLSVPADVDGLRFIVTSDRGRTVDQSFSIESGWPHSLTIVPADGMDSSVTIQLLALKDDLLVLRRVVRASFEPGITRRVDIVLTRACLGVMCPMAVDCVDGRCVDVAPLDAGPGDDGGPGTDAGPGDDAGPTDAGAPFDGGDTDGGGADGGTDAGGTDAGGTDAGPPDAGDGIFRCTDASCIGQIVISEFRTGGTSEGHEFVEIYNRSSMDIDVEGMELHYVSSGGSDATRSTVAASDPTVIPPGGFLLFGSNGYAGVPNAVDVADTWSTGLSGTGGTIYLLVNDGSDDHTIDMVGWGTASSPWVETAPIAGSGVCEQSCERKAFSDSTRESMEDGTGPGDHRLSGNGHDTGDNSADFIERNVGGPQTSASAVELP